MIKGVHPMFSSSDPEAPREFIRIAPLRFLALLLTGTFAVSNAAIGQDEPWARMDYGPFVSISVGLGDAFTPVNKGLVVRLRTLSGEPTDLHAVFDTDLLIWRCVWEGEIALRGIVYDGPHGVFPEIEGEPLFRFPPVPGVVAVDAATDPRDEPWGPVPETLARWTGLHLDGDDVIFEYTALDGVHRVLERVWAEPQAEGYAFVREITVATADATIDAGPTLRVLPGSGNERDATVSDGEYLRTTPGGTTVRTPSNGTIRLAIAPPGRERPSAPAAPPRNVRDAISRARPRWGAPLLTRGVLDDPLDSPNPADRGILHRAGDGARSIDLVTAGGGRLELLRNDAAVETGPAGDLVILRSLPTSTGQPWDEDDEIGWWPSDAGSGTHEHNAFTDAKDLRLDGVTWRRGVSGRSLDFDGTAAAWLDDLDLRLEEHDLTVAAWIHTTRDGTVFAVAPRQEWSPDGATLFLREGRLSFDIGWVGVVGGGPRIDDGTWHHVAATWRHERSAVRLFVDGERVAAGRLPLAGRVDSGEFVARFGWTNEDFPERSRFSGYMDGLMLLRRALQGDAIASIAERTGEPLAEATIVRWSGVDPGGAVLRLIGSENDGVARLEISPVATDVGYEVRTRRGLRSVVLAWANGAGREGNVATRPFRIDRITWPDDNPFGSWLRFGAFEFLPARDGNPTSGLISTWSGDLWRVDGLDEDLEELRWTRVATGLNQPFGIAIRGGETLVLGRDQITRIVDRNGDGEADFLENVSNAGRNSEHFHEPASGLLVEPDGSLLYIKAARHAKHALHDHHGTVLRVSPDGTTTEVVARGFRAPIGLTRLPDGSLLASDQEGHWTPANRINLIRPSSSAPLFFGNGWSARAVAGARIMRGGEEVQPAWDLDVAIVPPLCWLPPSVDRSPSSQVFVDHPAWGALEGSILGLSYGTGEVYLILRDDVSAADGSIVTQGGIVKLGIQFPTGLLAGRIHPATGDLYVCGLFGWSSDRTEPGGFFRIRPLAEQWSRSLNVPYRLRALPRGLELTFLHPLARPAATDPARWTATAWNYRRTANYGSASYALDGRRNARTPWTVSEVRLSADRRRVRLRIDDIEPVMQVHLTWSIADEAGRPLEHEAHLTIHRLPR